MAQWKTNRPQRGFYYVQDNREMFVPRGQIPRFFREWEFPTRIDDIRKMKYCMEDYVRAYNPEKDKIAFVRDAKDYLTLFLAPINQDLVEVEDFLSAIPLRYDGEFKPSDWDTLEVKNND